jgi:hypothetical protein
LGIPNYIIPINKGKEKKKGKKRKKGKEKGKKGKNLLFFLYDSAINIRTCVYAW